jgi:outer membrane protein
MKQATIFAVALGAALLAATGAQAQQTQGNWLVRARVIDIVPENKSDAGLVPADAVTLNNVVAPEVDFTYFFTKNIAAELILTYPQKHDVDLAGVGQIGTVKHLPPTLTLQYHFLPDGQYRPYIGAGINYTRFSSVNLNVAGVGPLYLESSSTGGALQIGMDIKLSGNMYLNFDLKKLWIGTDVTTGTGAKVTHLNINPWLPGVGLGWRF